MAASRSLTQKFTSNFAITVRIAARELLVQTRYRNKFFSDLTSHFLGIAPILLITIAFSGSSVNGSPITEISRNQTLFVALGYSAFVAFGYGNPLMLYTGMAWAISEEVETGTIERNFLAPVPRALLVVGIGSYYIALYAFHVITLVLIAVFLLGSDMVLTTESILIASLSIGGLMFLSVGLGVASAGLYLQLRDSHLFLLAVHRPFMVFSGAFFVIEVLPTPFQWVARVNPITYGIDAFRGSLSARDTLLLPWLELGIIYGAGLAVLVLGIWFFNSVLSRQFRTGELTRL